MIPAERKVLLRSVLRVPIARDNLRSFPHFVDLFDGPRLGGYERMDAGNWTAITRTQGIPNLRKEKTDLLDKVQLRLALTDQEFLDFLILLSELSGTGPYLRNVRLMV
jgi:hypothetical protein